MRPLASSTDIFSISIQNGHLIGKANLVVIGIILLAILIIFYIAKKFRVIPDIWSPEVHLSVPLGGIGSVSIRADYTVSQIAYTAWAELITRKAGLPIDIENDVIADVYKSWYQLFDKMRELVKTVPAHQLKKENTKNLIKLLTVTLNQGLRPHLTIWQAKFNKWYKEEIDKESNMGKTPQEIQKRYPEYSALLNDLVLINKQLVAYADELKKLARIDG